MAQRYAVRARVVGFVAAVCAVALTGCVESVGSMPQSESQTAPLLVPRLVPQGALKLERLFAHYPVDLLGVYRADSTGAAAWADSVIAQMTLEEKVAQLIIADYGRGRGSSVPRAVMRAVKDRGVGGILLPRVMKPTDVRKAVEALQAQADVPLLVAADFERGAGRFSSNLTELPSNMAIGAARDTVYAAAAGRLTAIESRALGVNLVFAPVADVNTNPRNPIINTRAYGDQPEEVAAHALAFSAEAERWGLLTTLKHFPGHGDTSVDTHAALATVRGEREDLDANGLRPFVIAAARGRKPAAIMTAHVWVPSLDREPLPATFSSSVLTGILREEMRYDGLVITDDIRMGALSTDHSLGERAVQPLAAGADIILTPERVESALSAIVRAVSDDKIPLRRIDQAARRVLLAKAHAGLHRQRMIGRAALDTLLVSPLGQRVADSIATAALTWFTPSGPVQGADVHTLPDAPGRSVVVHLANYEESESIVAAMDTLEARLRPARSYRSMPDVSDAERLRLLRMLADETDLLVALYMRLQSGRGSAGLFEGHHKLLSALLARSAKEGKPLTIVVLGDPYTAAGLPTGPRVLLGYDQSIATVHAVTDVLQGRAFARGVSPVTLAGPAHPVAPRDPNR